MLPSPRSNNALELHAYLTTISLPLQPLIEDSYLWSVENYSENAFSSTKTWNAIRHKEEEKSWASSVWFKGAIPKNAFNMWISHQDRLPTKSRMLSWGLLVSPVCALCQVGFETRDHIMLGCDYSVIIWALVRGRIGTPLTVFQSWYDLLKWTQRRNNAAPSTLRKIVAQAVVYALWKQRNNYVHNLLFIPAATVFRIIDREVINTITANRHRKQFRTLMGRWLH